MIRTIRRGLKEPLIHLLALGVALFALHRLVAPPPLTNRIVLSDAVIQGLRQDHLRRNGSLPTAAEEAGLIQRFVDDEILYREAIAEGLDRGDVIVRRRLVQKMEFVLDGAAPIPVPTDVELQTYLDAHRERYVAPERVSMAHVFVSSDQHPGQAEAIAEQLRQQLDAGADPATLGDPFVRGRRFVRQTKSELAGTFGPQFAAQVMRLPEGSWSAPVRSSYGWHVVRVSARQAERQPRLADVRQAVQRDWEEERRGQASRAALAQLRRQYQIEIERPGNATAALPAPAEASTLP